MEEVVSDDVGSNNCCPQEMDLSTFRALLPLGGTVRVGTRLNEQVVLSPHHLVLVLPAHIVAVKVRAR